MRITYKQEILFLKTERNVEENPEHTFIKRSVTGTFESTYQLRFLARDNLDIYCTVQWKLL